MRFSTAWLLIVSALIELAAGIALLIAPSAVTHLLVGVGLDSPESRLVARIAGAALLAIGLTCWAERGSEGARERTGLVAGLAAYNAAVVILFVWAGGVGKMHGLGLWPAIVLHAMLFTWCFVGLRFQRRRHAGI
jgi:hypothetical protein